MLEESLNRNTSKVVGEDEGVVGHGGHGEGERETKRLSNVSRK
jgi:hypothetical protein